MNNGKIANRYAKALLEFALEKKQEDRLYQEMKTLSGSFAALPALQQTLENPTLAVQEKEKLLITGAGMQVSEVFQSFLHLIMENKRETSIREISLHYQEFYRRYKKIVTGKLISAKEIPDKAKEQIKSIIRSGTGNEVDLVTEIDESLIGGFILDIESTRLDASVSNQLKEIKKQLLEKNKSIV
ncbi:MAG: F0F1 ATP synthase subunit delta [Candidatus Azobacteroides sp.]|nr:F0F1 ATP synthase subunit delta [Candidatus Azobacteroides sp.]